MNNAAIDGGGGGGDFDWGRLYAATGRIETLLGIIKGNELCQDYIKLANQQDNGLAPQSYWYATKPSIGSYSVEFTTVVPLPEDAQTAYAQYDDAMGQSFSNGTAWADGISGYLASMVGPLAEPSVASMQAISENLKAIPLWSLFPSDFSQDENGIGLSASLGHWWGESARSFETFYNNIDDVCARYAYVKDAAATWVDGCGALVAATRTGLLEFLEKVEAHLEAVCEEWVATKGLLIGVTPSPIPVMKVVDVAITIAEALPVVDKVVALPAKLNELGDQIGALKDFAGLISTYTGLSLDSLAHEELKLDQVRAEDIYELITSTIVNKHITPLQDGFDEIASSKTTNVANEVGSIADGPGSSGDGESTPGFFPNKVPESIKTDPSSWEGR